MEYIVKIYKDANQKKPFSIWLNNLSDMKARVAVEMRIDRLKLGNFGQSKSLQEGLFELKVDVGPGYRVYFGKIGKQIVLLLSAGNKKTQQKDIKKAREYLKDHKLSN